MPSYSENSNAIISLNDHAQLVELESIIDSLAPEDVDQVTMSALFAIFERFPWEDGSGIFWSILHLLEACSGYEKYLVRSVEIKPGQFTLAMLNRLLNADIIMVDDINIVSLLKQISNSPIVDEKARVIAHEYVGN